MNKIREIASGLVGIPYRLGGRDTAGLDCLGLIWLFYKLNGIDIPDSDGAEYNEDWLREDPGRYIHGLLKLGVEAPLDDLKPLDLLYFSFNGYITHTGVMIDLCHFLHVMKTIPVSITPLQSNWQKRLAGARRLI